MGHCKCLRKVILVLSMDLPSQRYLLPAKVIAFTAFIPNNGHFSAHISQTMSCNRQIYESCSSTVLLCYNFANYYLGSRENGLCREVIFWVLLPICIADSKGTMLLLVIFSGAMLLTKDSPMHTELSVSTF